MVLPLKLFQTFSSSCCYFDWLESSSSGSSQDQHRWGSAAVDKNGHGAAAGVLRDHRGCWIAGFQRGLGTVTPLAAELWAIRDGLQLSLEHSNAVEVETDALIAIHLLQDSNSVFHPFMSTICRSLMEKLQMVQLNHVYREANKTADVLAKDALAKPLGFTSFTIIPNVVRFQFDDDFVGATYPIVQDLIYYVNLSFAYLSQKKNSLLLGSF